MTVMMTRFLGPREAVTALGTTLAAGADARRIEGRWAGRAAEEAGLAGTCLPVALGELASGREPGGRGSVLAWMGERGAVGWIMTVAAPGTVAAAAMSDAGLAQAHDEAVRAAFAAAEQEACDRGANPTRALAAAIFPHGYESAAGPVLEHRILLFNLTCSGGQLAELEFGIPYKARETVEAVYYTQLRTSVERLGYEVESTGLTWFEIRGAAARGGA